MEIDRQAKTAVPVLLGLLKDEDIYVRLAAVSALGRFGPAAKAAVPALSKMLGDENAGGKAAKEALEKIRRSSGRPQLILPSRRTWQATVGGGRVTTRVGMRYQQALF